MKENKLWKTVILVFTVVALLMFLHARRSVRMQHHEKMKEMQQNHPISTSVRYGR
jgi:hypothetical protein